MPDAAATALPTAAICDQARRSRDARFDGLFFTAVHSTRIYCRPVCPAPYARHVSYYPSAAAAEGAGYRPCLRCRPELAPGDGSWRRGDAALARALKLIDQGALADASLASLAAGVGIGERQLRRLFVDRLGAPPIGVHGTRRLLFAKQLLTETAMPVTEVALASGFGSLRRFNTTFKAAYRLAPRDLRRQPGAARDALGAPLSLRLVYRPPYDFAAMLDFLRGRALPGVEHVDSDSYARVVAGAATASAAGCASAPGPAAATPCAGAASGAGAAPARDRRPPAADVRHGRGSGGDRIGACRRSPPRAVACGTSRPALPGGWDGFEVASAPCSDNR